MDKPAPITFTIPPELTQQWFENAAAKEYRKWLNEHPPDPLLMVDEAAAEMRVTARHVRSLLGKEFEYRDEEGRQQKEVFDYENAGYQLYRIRKIVIDLYLKRHQRKGRRR